MNKNLETKRDELAEKWAYEQYPRIFRETGDTILGQGEVDQNYGRRLFAKRVYAEGFNACADVVHNSPIEHLVDVLNEDEGYAISFKANLALTFADEVFRSHQYKGVHEMANIAALNFMKKLGYTTQEQEK